MDEISISTWIAGESHNFSITGEYDQSNIMVGVYDMRFTFIHTSWEGSAHNRTICVDAIIIQ